MGLQLPHIILLLVIILLLFGAGRISGIMGELGKGFKSFKEGMGDEEEEKRKRYEEQRRSEPPRLPGDQEPIDVTPRRDEPAATPPRDDETR
ncbi:MAG TPA: twin-arginine translocase TatA/TatE family subunit [Sphingomicrobium sp.]